MVVSSLLASGWLSKGHHLVELVVVVALLLLLVLLLVRLRWQRQERSGKEETYDLTAEDEFHSPMPLRGGLAEQLEEHLQSSFERLRTEERRLDQRLAELSGSEAEFEQTAQERVARLAEWEQRLEGRESQLAPQEAAAEELYRARELEL